MNLISYHFPLMFSVVKIIITHLDTLPFQFTKFLNVIIMMQLMMQKCLILEAILSSFYFKGIMEIKVCAKLLNMKYEIFLKAS